MLIIGFLLQIVDISHNRHFNSSVYKEVSCFAWQTVVEVSHESLSIIKMNSSYQSEIPRLAHGASSLYAVKQVFVASRSVADKSHSSMV